MLFKWEIEVLWEGFKSVKLDPLTIWNIFYYFFENNFQRENEKKMNLGNKERPSVHETRSTSEKQRGFESATFWENKVHK